MKRRPWPIVILTALHFLAAPGNFFWHAFITQTPIDVQFEIYLMEVNRLYSLIFFLLPLFAGSMIYICKRWSFYGYLAAYLSMAGLSTYGYIIVPGQTPLFWLILFLLINILVVTYFMVPAVRTVYFDPRLRWWDHKPRYRSGFEAVIRSTGSDSSLASSNGVISNFSEGGLFFQTETPLADNLNGTVEFIFDGKKIILTGKIIHHKARLAMGFGFQFQEDRANLEISKKVVKLLDAQGMKIPPPPLSPEEHFRNWMIQFFKTGRGLFPQTKS